MLGLNLIHMRHHELKKKARQETFCLYLDSKYHDRHVFSTHIPCPRNLHKCPILSPRTRQEERSRLW